MATKSQQNNRTSYIYSILSVSLVLFLLGLLGILLLNATRISKQMKENVELSLILKDTFRESDTDVLLQFLGSKEYIQESTYVSKDEAAARFTQDYGEDFVELLEYNPLYSSVKVRLNAAFMQDEQIARIETELLKSDSIKEVFYQKNLLSLINENFRKLGVMLLILSSLLLFMAITLIDSTIRLAMFSNRFLIKSMQLVGATRWLVSKPFIQRSVWNGGISGLIAGTSVGILLYLMDRSYPELGLAQDPFEYFIIFSCIMLIGIFISYWSTRGAVRKYLKLKLDELY